MCVFLGVATRSTIAALLLTLLFWFGIWIVGAAEKSLLMVKTMQKEGVNFAATRMEESNRTPKSHTIANRTKSSHKADQPVAAETDASESSESTAINVAYEIFYGIKTVLPKTTDTIELLERSLMKAAKLPQSGHPQERRMMAAQQQVIDVLRGRSIAWVVGTSLGFEAVVLAFAALIFCRRDY